MRSALGLGLGILLFVACGSSPESPGTGGGGSATTSTTTSSTSTSATETCAAALDGECGTCMKGACCDTLTACEADPDCAACITATDPTACEKTPETHARAQAYLSCKGGPCQAACIGGNLKPCQGALDGLVSAGCQTCLEGSCCAEVSACQAHTGCWGTCLQGGDEAACHADADGHALYEALVGCLNQGCAGACGAPVIDPACDAPATAPSGGECAILGGAVACNPVTNEGCTTAGSACDQTTGGFKCYPAPNTEALCAACGETAGWCAPGMTCVGGKCARYCCDDGDCGTGHCDKTTLGLGDVGACAK